MVITPNNNNWLEYFFLAMDLQKVNIKNTYEYVTVT